MAQTMTPPQLELLVLPQQQLIRGKDVYITNKEWDVEKWPDTWSWTRVLIFNCCTAIKDFHLLKWLSLCGPAVGSGNASVHCVCVDNRLCTEIYIATSYVRHAGNLHVWWCVPLPLPHSKSKAGTASWKGRLSPSLDKHGRQEALVDAATTDAPFLSNHVWRWRLSCGGGSPIKICLSGRLQQMPSWPFLGRQIQEACTIKNTGKLEINLAVWHRVHNRESSHFRGGRQNFINTFGVFGLLFLHSLQGTEYRAAAAPRPPNMGHNFTNTNMWPCRRTALYENFYLKWTFPQWWLRN